MKKILLVVFTALAINIPALVKSQSFTTQYGDTVRYFVGGAGYFHNDITNTTGSPITLTWHVQNSFFPTDWNAAAAFGICDNNLCRNNMGDTILWNMSTHAGMTFTSSSYNPGVAGAFELSLDFTSVSTGSHPVTIRLTDAANSYSKDITFILTKVPVGVQNVNSTNTEVELYPNPARDEVNLVYDASADIRSIAVYNIIGKAMVVYKVNNTSANLNIENLPSGIYFARLMNGEGRVVSTKKFTKQ